jgi:hypothetical protein
LHIKLFLYVTKQVSQSAVPLIYEVMPFIDTLFDALEDEATNIDNLPAVRMAAKRGHTMLSKYYGLTDHTHIYRMAMSMSFIFLLSVLLAHWDQVLHPAHKVTYFRKCQWPEDWITTALNLVCEEWQDRYKEDVEIVSGEETQTATTRQVIIIYLMSCPRSHVYQDTLTQKYFGATSHPLTSDPLEMYLADPVILSVGNPLAYWQSIISSNATNAPLTHMALDFLSTPG